MNREDMADLVTKALRQAWGLGQNYWQQADSESLRQQRKSSETFAKYEALISETRAAILGEQPK